MLGNVAFGAGLGAIPLVGDVFDLAWKANVRNVALLRAQRRAAGREGCSPRQIMGLLAVALGVLFLGLVALSIGVWWLVYKVVTA
jgi:hypothetical protein